jgi:hypothetical protein
MCHGLRCQQVYSGLQPLPGSVLTGACAPRQLRPRELTAAALKQRGRRGTSHHGVGRQWGTRDLAADNDERAVVERAR